MKARRPVALMVVCWFAFLSVWTPRQAYAFAPVAVIGAPQIVSAGGSAYLLTLAGLSALVGIVGMYLEIKDVQENAIRIPLGPNQNNEPPAPAAELTTSISTSVRWGSSGGPYIYDSPSAWCSSNVASGRSCACNDNTGVCVVSGDVPSYTISADSHTVVSCPTGYANVSGVCNLTNARQVQDDKTCDILMASWQFHTADDLNCPQMADGSKLTPMIRDGKVIAYGKNSNGDLLMWEVEPAPSKFTIRQWRQIISDMQTQVQKTEVEVDTQTSTITSVSTSTSPGSLASPSAGSVPTTTDPQAQPTSSENTPTVRTRDGEQLFPDFPSDYAREPTIQQIRDALTQQKQPPEDPIHRTGSEIEDQFFKNTFDSLKGWTLPGHSSQCPTGSFDAFGSTHVIEAHCTLINNHWGILQAAMLVVWSIAALWIVLRA